MERKEGIEKRMLEELGEIQVQSPASILQQKNEPAQSVLHSVSLLGLPDPDALVAWATSQAFDSTTVQKSFSFESLVPLFLYISVSWMWTPSVTPHVSVSSKINQLLQSEDHIHVKDYLFHLLKSYYLLPSAKDETVYRVTILPFHKLSDFETGHSVYWRGFSSATANKDLVQKLIEKFETTSLTSDVKQTVVLFEIQVEEGRHLKNLIIEDADLQEILLAPFSEFYVLSSRSMTTLPFSIPPNTAIQSSLQYQLIQLKQIPVNTQILLRNKTSPSQTDRITSSPTPSHKSLSTSQKASLISASKSVTENMTLLKTQLEKGTPHDLKFSILLFLEEYYIPTSSSATLLPEDPRLVELCVQKLDDIDFFKSCPYLLLILELLAADPLTKAKLNRQRLWFKFQRLLPELNGQGASSSSVTWSVYVCRFVGVLALNSSESVQLQFVEDGVWKDLKQLMSIYPSNSALQQQVWSVVAHLATPVAGAERIMKEGWALLKAALLFHGTDPHVTLSALQAIAQLAVHSFSRALISREMQNLVRDVMIRFENDPQIQETSARIILNLALEPHLRTGLMSLWTPLLHGMDKHVGISTLQAACCGAIAHLGIDPSNKSEVLLNGWYAVKRAMLKSGGKRDPNLLWRGCSVIVFCGWEHPPSVSTLYAAGAWDAVKFAMEAAPLNPQVISWCCSAVYCLASSPRIAKRLFLDGALRVIRDRLGALGVHGSVKKWANRAISRFDRFIVTAQNE